MQIYTSYFYQIRNFTPNMIPISTAVWDPKWFHDFKDANYIFKDKNGVYNGIRCPILAPGSACEGLCQGVENCEGKNTPDKCKFLQQYKQQLDKIDYKQFMQDLEELVKKIDIDNPIVVFIVYETPKNPCSERQTIIDWFNIHGNPVKELTYPIGLSNKLKVENFDF